MQTHAKHATHGAHQGERFRSHNDASSDESTTTDAVIRELTESDAVQSVVQHTAPTVFALATSKELQQELGRLEKRLYTIDDRMLDDTALASNGDGIRTELMEAKKAKLKITIRLNALRYESNNLKDDEYTALQEKLEQVDRLLKIFEEYSAAFTQKQIKRGIDLLTAVTVVFLPLTCCICFFGMNFGSMGSLTAPGASVFAQPRAHLWVLGLGILYAIGSVAVMRRVSQASAAA